MLFDPRPKSSKKDLFDFDRELNELIKYLDEPLTVVSGLRRTGKTSLILTALNESKRFFLYVDLREGASSAKSLYQLLSRSLSDFSKKLQKKDTKNLFSRIITKVRGVSLMGVEIQINWSPRKRPLISELFNALDELAEKLNTKLVIVLDEFQHSRTGYGLQLQNAVAHSYDFNKNLSFVLSGSQIGLLNEVLGNPKNPLYGRAYIEVKTRKLLPEESIEFLTKGFTEANINIDKNELENVVSKLNGIIGWLTYYGYLKLKGKTSLDDVLKEAVTLARSELESFLSTRLSKRYKIIMRLLSHDITDWTSLKRELEKSEGREVSDRALYEILQQLKKHSIIDENNKFTDPINKKAAEEF